MSGINFLGELFPSTISSNNGVDTVTKNFTSTGTGRSNYLYVPALSKLVIHISATASVQVISNPFNNSAKDIVLQTITATGSYTFAAADVVAINITANTGTVSAVVVYNTEID